MKNDANDIVVETVEIGSYDAGLVDSDKIQPRTRHFFMDLYPSVLGAKTVNLVFTNDSLQAGKVEGNFVKVYLYEHLFYSTWDMLRTERPVFVDVEYLLPNGKVNDITIRTKDQPPGEGLEALGHRAAQRTARREALQNAMSRGT